MRDIPLPGQHPVEVSAYTPGAGVRKVRIVRLDGAVITEDCASQAQFEAIVEQHRPGTDLADREQVHWVDHPDKWIGL